MDRTSDTGTLKGDYISCGARGNPHYM